jgi:hypothetical protein
MESQREEPFLFGNAAHSSLLFPCLTGILEGKRLRPQNLDAKKKELASVDDVS